MIGFKKNVGLIYSFLLIFVLIEIDSFFTYADDRSPERYKDCKTGTTPETESVIKRLGGGTGVQCIFPFTLEANNKTYHSCTYDFMHVTGYQPWCSTKVDKNGVHMRDVGEDVKNWGICTDASSCPIPPRRCGTVKSTFQENYIVEESKSVDIRHQPWLVSIGELISPNNWEHKCSGTIITDKHVLTSASCVSGIPTEYNWVLDKEVLSYSIRMGSTDTNNGALERKIKSIHIHPEYKNYQYQFDVGIIEFDKTIEFNDYINQVCLPYLPMDLEQYKEYDRLTISGYYNLESCNASETIASMEISSHQLDSIKNCHSQIAKDLKLDAKLNQNLACTKESIGTSSRHLYNGSPAVKLVSDTARLVPYYEQHFVVSSASVRDSNKNEKQVKYLTRITDRSILLWIQEKTDTSPLVMVVGGYSNLRELKNPVTNKCEKDKSGKCVKKPGLINDVEVIKLSKNAKEENRCTKFVSPIFGFSYILGKDKDGMIVENEAEILGHTGQFAKDTAIVCGGLNGDGDSNLCYEWDFMVNRWKSHKRHPKDGIVPMKLQRDRAGSSLTKNGNIWIIGGRNEMEEGLTSSEIYDYRPKGNGKWRKGPNIPKDLPGGLESHCAVRINSTHTMIIGGFNPVYGDDGGYQNKRTWIYNSSHWIETAATKIARDRPACSLVNLSNGKVQVLVTGGCDGWCAENPAISSSEMYDPERNSWKRVADLPEPLSSTNLELLDNRPTTFGGYNQRDQVSTLYQYFIEEDKWRPHPHTKLRMARSSAAVFQVPREMFRC